MEAGVTVYPSAEEAGYSASLALSLVGGSQGLRRGGHPSASSGGMCGEAISLVGLRSQEHAAVGPVARGDFMGPLSA